MNLLRTVTYRVLRFYSTECCYCEYKPVMETVRLSLLLQIPELSKINVKIPNPERVCDKLRKMSEESNKMLQIVADFDKTITKPTVDGQPCVGSLEVFKIMDGVPIKFLMNSKELLMNYYKSIKETIHTLDDRIRATDELAKKLEQQLHVVPFTDDSIFEQEAAKGVFILREGTSTTFNLLHDNSVPILVLSGGLACIIDKVLQDQGLLRNNVHVMANSFKYKDGHIEGFKGDLIHFFNKNIFYLKCELYKKELSKRRNIILFGDAPADSEMTEGVPDTFNVLKIGFFHDNLFQEDVDEFSKRFDIVITEDETLHVVNAILSYVLSHPSQ